MGLMVGLHPTVWCLGNPAVRQTGAQGARVYPWLDWSGEGQMEMKMFGYMAAEEMVVVERRKRKQKSKVLGYITLPGLVCCIP